MTASTPALAHLTNAAHFRPRLRVLYLVEAMCELSIVLTTVGIYFFATHRFGWGLWENFVLAMSQGVVYLAGSLLTGKVARRIGRQRTLILLCAQLAVISAAPLLSTAPIVVIPVVLLYTAMGASCWPAIESLIADGTDAHDLSRRIGAFNFVWASVSAVALAINGALIELWPPLVFLISALCNVISIILLTTTRPVLVRRPAHAHLEPEPRLLAQRKLAMWLSRIAMPAVMVAISSLLAMLPLLGVMQNLDTTAQTLVSSIWMAARWLAFVLLGAGIWWHTRPRILLGAIVLLLVAFLGITLRPGDWLGVALPWKTELAMMILWQIALGAAAGMIYVGSLYFGLVLSHGSTEQGGYHEAMIGLGSILGPAAGAMAQWHRPGDIIAGVIAVAAIIVLTLIIALGVSVRFSSRPVVV